MVPPSLRKETSKLTHTRTLFFLALKTTFLHQTPTFPIVRSNTEAIYTAIIKKSITSKPQTNLLKWKTAHPLQHCSLLIPLQHLETRNTNYISLSWVYCHIIAHKSNIRSWIFILFSFPKQIVAANNNSQVHYLRIIDTPCRLLALRLTSQILYSTHKKSCSSMSNFLSSFRLALPIHIDSNLDLTLQSCNSHI